MKLLVIAVVIILAVLIVVNIVKKKSMEKYFTLPPGEILIIDVRSKQEFDAGHYSTAINIPHDQIGNQISKLEPYKQKTILLYCHSGNRAAAAENVLRKNGFVNVVNAGGYSGIIKYDRKK
jgi:rhodanese-related sulfurtransferase